MKQPCQTGLDETHPSKQCVLFVLSSSLDLQGTNVAPEFPQIKAQAHLLMIRHDMKHEDATGGANASSYCLQPM